MKCPRDDTRLESLSIEDYEAFVCPKCHGLLVHREQFEKIKAKAQIAHPRTSKTRIKVSEGTARSPVNGEMMQVIDLDGVQVDFCLTSNYIWFDHGEIDSLLRKQKKKSDSLWDGVMNTFDVIDAFQLTELLGEIIEGISDGASSCIDF